MEQLPVQRRSTYQAMTGYRVLAFLLFQGMINVYYLAAAEDATSSPSAYFTTHENQRLEGHVVEQFESPSSTSCSYSCLKNPWCTSTNFQLLSEKNGQGTCELNKHGVLDEIREFNEQDGVTSPLILKVRHWPFLNSCYAKRRNEFLAGTPICKCVTHSLTHSLTQV